MTKKPTNTPVYLFENDRYYVVVGEVWLDDRQNFGPGYQLVNKETSVIEAERTNFPEAIMLAKRLQEATEMVLNPTPVADREIPDVSLPSPERPGRA